MTVHRPSPTRIEQQIAVCDTVLERLAQLDDSNTLEGLIEDVRTLRASLQQLASTDGDGSRPPGVADRGE